MHSPDSASQPRIVYDAPSSIVRRDVLAAVSDAFAAAEGGLGPCGDGPIIWYRREPGGGLASREMPFRVMPLVHATGIYDPEEGSIWLQIDRPARRVAESAYHEAVHRFQHAGKAGDGTDVEREATALAQAYWLRNWPDGGPEDVRRRWADDLVKSIPWWPTGRLRPRRRIGAE